jgi:hypothetical protein
VAHTTSVERRYERKRDFAVTSEPKPVRPRKGAGRSFVSYGSFEGTIPPKQPGDKQEAWLLFKKRDAWARADDYDVTEALPDSVVRKPLGLLEERETVAEPAAQPTSGESDPSKAKRAR